jgi:hypothetical protein
MNLFFEEYLDWIYLIIKYGPYTISNKNLS